jgi:hypothetical protein
MASAKEVVLGFHKAVNVNKDFTAARQFLQDEIEFSGPFDTFHAADDYLHAIQKLSTVVDRVDIKKVFEDGSDVAIFCDLVTKVVGTSFVSEWYQVKNGKIAGIKVVFDARPWAPMFAKKAV